MRREERLDVGRRQPAGRSALLLAHQPARIRRIIGGPAYCDVGPPLTRRILLSGAARVVVSCLSGRSVTNIISFH